MTSSDVVTDYLRVFSEVCDRRNFRCPQLSTSIEMEVAGSDRYNTQLINTLERHLAVEQVR